jgi:hypothetical protein
LLGCVQTIGYVANSPNIKGIGFATVASPLPLVFSVYNGYETFSTTFEISATLANQSIIQTTLDHKLYGKLQGPYNRRNVYGAVFAFGPFFNTENLLQLRQSILKHGICENHRLDSWGTKGLHTLRRGLDQPLMKELGLGYLCAKKIQVTIKSKTLGNENKTWMMEVIC